ncbi:MAG: hypothetical protein PHV30_00540 [Candidatus Margulisbacteria bacterium]|nr:hypothetical protein [Candidatus Margulisiibacteriota bacterium]
MAEEINGTGIRITGIQALKDNTAEGTAIFTLHVGGSIGTKSYTKEQLLDLAKRAGFNGLENLFTKQNLKDLDSFSLTGKKIVSDNLNDDHSILEALVTFFIDCKVNGGVDNSKAEELLKTISSLPDKFSKMQHGNDKAAYVKTLDLKSLFEKAIGTEKDNFLNDSPNYQFSKGISEGMVKQSLGLDGTGQPPGNTDTKVSEKRNKMGIMEAEIKQLEGKLSSKEAIILETLINLEDIKDFPESKIGELRNYLAHLENAKQKWFGSKKECNMLLNNIRSVLGLAAVDEKEDIDPKYLKALDDFERKENGKSFVEIVMNYKATIKRNGSGGPSSVFTKEEINKARKGYLPKISRDARYLFLDGSDVPWTNKQCSMLKSSLPEKLFEYYAKFCTTTAGIDYRKMMACFMADLADADIMSPDDIKKFYRKDPLDERFCRDIKAKFNKNSDFDEKLKLFIKQATVPLNSVIIAEEDQFNPYEFLTKAKANNKLELSKQLKEIWDNIGKNHIKGTVDTTEVNPFEQAVGGKLPEDIAGEVLREHKDKVLTNLRKISDGAKSKLNIDEQLPKLIADNKYEEARIYIYNLPKTSDEKKKMESYLDMLMRAELIISDPAPAKAKELVYLVGSMAQFSAAGNNPQGYAQLLIYGIESFKTDGLDLNKLQEATNFKATIDGKQQTPKSPFAASGLQGFGPPTEGR